MDARFISYRLNVIAQLSLLLEDLLGIHHSLIKNYSSLELIKAVVALRSVKEACEIEQINLACNIGYEMHVAAMKHALPGQKEKMVATADRGELPLLTEVWFLSP